MKKSLIYYIDDDYKKNIDDDYILNNIKSDLIFNKISNKEYLIIKLINIFNGVINFGFIYTVIFMILIKSRFFLGGIKITNIIYNFCFILILWVISFLLKKKLKGKRDK